MSAEAHSSTTVVDAKGDGKGTKDDLAFWPTAATLVLVILGVALRLVGIENMLTSLTLSAAAILLLLAALVLSTLAVWKGRFRRAISYAVPVLVFAALRGEEEQFGVISLACDRWRFDLTHERYEAQLPAVDSSGGPRLSRFDWLEGGWDTPIELVFDESDEIALPQGRQSQEWLRRANSDSIYTTCSFSSRRIESHFYVVDFAC